jgi:trimeric autotransporter adhesin
MKIQSICLPLIALLASGKLEAVTVLYSTGFDSPTYSDGALIGQDSWVITGTSVVNPINVANTATNGTVSLTTTGQDVRRAFAPAVNSGSVYLTASITVGAAQATGDYFLHLGDNTASNFYARTYIKSSGSGFVMALGTSSGTPTYGTTVLNFATSYTILVRYDIVAGAGNDTGALFVNPTTADGTGDTAYVAATTVGTDASTISSVSLRQGSGTAAPTVTINSIAVAVPEPGAVLLGSFGLLSLLRRRR